MSSYFLKNVFVVLTILFLTITTGCNFKKYFDPNWLNSINFNNRFAEGINEMADKAQKAQELYQETVPETVDNTTEIEISDMAAVYDDLEVALKEFKKLSDLKCRDEKRQEAVMKKFEEYFKAIQEYDEIYKEVLLFYETKEYRKIAEDVSTLDGKLKEVYKNYIEIHNEMVEELGKKE